MASSVRARTAREVRLIYEASFPPEQRVPFVALMNSVASGERTLWLSEGNHGFALTKGLETTGHEVLLEYLAVKPEWRSRGVGSLLLHDVYAGGGRPLVFEVEDVGGHVMGPPSAN